MAEVRERFGEAFTRGEHASGNLDMGFWGAFSEGMGAGWRLTADRWASFNDTSETLSGDAFLALVGDRSIPYRDGVTRQQAQAMVVDYDHQEYMSAYKGRPVAEFLGMMPPSLLDPVSVATLPVGGANLARAAGANSLRQFLAQSGKAGLKVSAASAIPEAVVEQATHGEVRPAEYFASVLAPIALSPVLAAPGRALHGLSARRVARRVQAAQQVDHPHTLSERAVRGMDDDTIPPPPVHAVDTTPPLPKARLAEMFDGYEGGPKRWISDLSRALPQAIKQAQAMGIDPEAPALRALMEVQARRTVNRSPLDGLAVAEQARDLQAATAGSATEAQWAQLVRAGAAHETPAGPVLHPEAERMAQILSMPDSVRMKAEREAAVQFARTGLEGPTLTRLQAAAAEHAQMRAAETPDAEALAALSGEIARLRQALSRVDERTPTEDILKALDAARLQSPPAPRPDMAPPQEGAVSRLLGPDEEIARIKAEASRAGFTLDEVEKVVTAIEKNILECGV